MTATLAEIAGYVIAAWLGIELVKYGLYVLFRFMDDLRLALGRHCAITTLSTSPPRS